MSFAKLAALLPAGRPPPLRLDPSALARRRPQTIVVYQKAVRLFLAWVVEHQLVLGSLYELDDLLVEWRFMMNISKAIFAHAVAAIEVAIPGAKACLPWAHTVMKDLILTVPAQHHIAMPWKIALIVAVTLAAAGASRLGAGILVQHTRGLRPSELLGLRQSDVLLPEDRPLRQHETIVLNLGMKSGTKARRAQAVMIPVAGHPVTVSVLTALKRSTPPNQLIFFGTNLGTYQRLLAQACNALGIPIFTPHSARAGFATDLMMAGTDFVSIRELGRWLSDQSLRIYLDAVTTASVEASEAGHTWAPIANHIQNFFGCLFPWWEGTGWCPTMQLPVPILEAAWAMKSRRRSRKTHTGPPMQSIGAVIPGRKM